MSATTVQRVGAAIVLMFGMYGLYCFHTWRLMMEARACASGNSGTEIARRDPPIPGATPSAVTAGGLPYETKVVNKCCWNRAAQPCVLDEGCDKGGEGCRLSGTPTSQYGAFACNTTGQRQHPSVVRPHNCPLTHPVHGHARRL